MSLDINEKFELPEGCPIPGAIYRQKIYENRWAFATVTALEVLPQGRWAAIFSSVRFGDERITSEFNKLDKYQLHSVPSIIEIDSKPEESITPITDELDILLSAGA
tara:strand:- start:15015 stop:15332 length:318 start_codon:yes stop_codon:yes gene_type:complete